MALILSNTNGLGNLNLINTSGAGSLVASKALPFSYEYNIFSTTGYANGFLACQNQIFDPSSPVYAATSEINSIVAFYTDIDLTIPFVGGDNWWAFGNGITVNNAQISNSGVVSNDSQC